MWCLPPSLEWVHSAAVLSRRFRTWLDKACSNFGVFLKLGGVVEGRLRRERREELTGADRTRFTEALMEYERLDKSLYSFSNLKRYTDFVSWTGEDLIKWVGDEVISLGYCGFREGCSQHWLWDYRAEKLPYEHKIREVFGFYGVERYLKIPTQKESLDMLFEFLEHTTKLPMSQLEWLVKYVYPLSDETGGFYSVFREIMELGSLRDAWDEILYSESYVADELEKMPQFKVLAGVLESEWDASNYVRKLVADVREEFLDKYGETMEAPEKVNKEFLDRAKEVFASRVPSEDRILEVYSEVKGLYPEKAEKRRGGLLRAIRWAFIHPESKMEHFVSGFIFPLDFTTEEAKAVASKILEKVTKVKPIPLPPPPPPPPKPAPPPPKIEYVQVRMLKEVPEIVGADMKTYGPFKAGEIVRLPKANAEALVKHGLASYELAPPPPKPAVEKALKELPEEKAKLETDLMDDAYQEFVKADVVDRWVERRGTIRRSIRESISLYEDKPKSEAERLVRDRVKGIVARIISELKAAKAPPARAVPYRPPPIPPGVPYGVVVPSGMGMKAEIMKRLRSGMSPKEVIEAVKAVYGWTFDEKAAASYYRARCIEMNWVIPEWVKKALGMA